MKKTYTYKGAHHFCGVTFPDGNKKQDRMISIALAPAHTCPIDAPCRKENGGSCYYQAEEGRYPSVAVSAANNYSVYIGNQEKFWKGVEKAIQYAIREGIGFRWFEGGDIPNYEFFCRIMDYARLYPGLMHGMTKQYHIINRYIAEHGGNRGCVLDYYKLRFSEWTGYPMENPYDMPVFALTFEEEETTCLEQKMKMAGKEWSCSDCYLHGIGCYRADNASICCIDHATEQKIIRSKKKEGKI